MGTDLLWRLAMETDFLWRLAMCTKVINVLAKMCYF